MQQDHNYLYRPDKQARIALRRGEQKKRIRWLKADKRIVDAICTHCGKDIYAHTNGDFLTLAGSKHECKGIKNEIRNEAKSLPEGLS